MSVLVLFAVFTAGVCLGGVLGIVLGFVWYERKCGLLSDPSGQRVAAVRYKLDDVFGLAPK